MKKFVDIGRQNREFLSFWEDNDNFRKKNKNFCKDFSKNSPNIASFQCILEECLLRFLQSSLHRSLQDFFSKDSSEKFSCILQKIFKRLSRKFFHNLSKAFKNFFFRNSFLRIRLLLEIFLDFSRNFSCETSRYASKVLKEFPHRFH